jgi:parallel beta-helix repeat protein
MKMRMKMKMIVHRGSEFTVFLLLIASAMYFAVPMPLAAETYYLSSTSGNDNKDGHSPETAWRNLSQIYLRSSSKGAFQAGDKILLKRGDRWFGQIRLQANGTVQNPIRIDSYGDGAKPLLYGENTESYWQPVPGHRGVFTTDLGEGNNAGPIFLNGNKLQVIYLKGPLVNAKDREAFLSRLQPASLAGRFGSELWIRTKDGVSPKGTVRIFLTAGVSLADSSYIQVQNLDVERFYTGIDITNSHQITIRHNDIQDVFGIGIYLRSANVDCLVESNTVFRAGNTALYVLKGTGNAFRDNWVSHVDREILGIPVHGDDMGVGLERSRQTLVEYNYFTHSGGIDFYYEENSIVRYNYLYHVRSAGAPHGVNLQVNGNIYNLGEEAGEKGSAGINAIVTGPGTIAVFNNTIVNASRFFLMGSSNKEGNVVFSDNIVFSSVPGNKMAVFGANVASNHNCFSTPAEPVFQYKTVSFASLETYQTASGLDKDSVFSDPDFFSSELLTPLDFQIGFTSGCKVAALNTPFSDLSHAGTYDRPHFVPGDPVIGALRTDKAAVEIALRDRVCTSRCFQHPFAVPIGVYLVRLRFVPGIASGEKPDFSFLLNGRKVVTDFRSSETIAAHDPLLQSFLVRTNTASITLQADDKEDISAVGEVDIVAFDAIHGDGLQVIPW